MRAYKIATTPPMEPVLITADITCRSAGPGTRATRSRGSSRARAAAGRRAALAEAARWLVGAGIPVIVADRACATRTA